MTPSLPRADTASVGVPARKVTLEIDPASDPISGRVADGQGCRPFAGWLELAAALQAALDDGEPDAPASG